MCLVATHVIKTLQKHGIKLTSKRLHYEISNTLAIFANPILKMTIITRTEVEDIFEENIV